MIIVSRICCLSVCRSLFCGNQTKISMSAQDGADETALERTFRWHIGLLTPAMKCCNLRSVSNSSCKADRRTIASGDLSALSCLSFRLFHYYSYWMDFRENSYLEFFYWNLSTPLFSKIVQKIPDTACGHLTYVDVVSS